MLIKKKKNHLDPKCKLVADHRSFIDANFYFSYTLLHKI